MYEKNYSPKLLEIVRTQGYSAKRFKQDLSAGLTVSVISIPLSMALAIASGTTPDRGLFTAIVAGFLISFLGGSRFQIGGPTGAFVVVIFNIIAVNQIAWLALVPRLVASARRRGEYRRLPNVKSGACDRTIAKKTLSLLHEDRMRLDAARHGQIVKTVFSICLCTRLSLYLDNIGCGSTWSNCENCVFNLPLYSPFTIFVEYKMRTLRPFRIKGGVAVALTADKS